MMPKPRKSRVLLDEASYYHCVSHCVRLAFLYGVDTSTGKYYEHRHQWIVDRMTHIAGAFAIDIYAYAVISKHYHVTPHIDSERAAGWSHQDIIDRWKHLFSKLEVVNQPDLAKEAIKQKEQDTIPELLGKWR
jgi:hypothetical protein